MKITLKDALMLQQGVKSLMKDGELNIKTKLDLVTLGEEVDAIVKPFMTVRQEVFAKHTVTKDDGTKELNREAIESELAKVIEEEKELSIEGFELTTSKDDKFVTGEMLYIFRQIFGDKFVLNAD